MSIITKALKKELNTIKKRLKEIDDINKITLSNLVDLQIKGVELIQEHQKTNSEVIFAEIGELAKKEKHYRQCLDYQSKNLFYMNEINKLKRDKRSLEHRIGLEEIKHSSFANL